MDAYPSILHIEDVACFSVYLAVDAQDGDVELRDIDPWSMASHGADRNTHKIDIVATKGLALAR